MKTFMAITQAWIYVLSVTYVPAYGQEQGQQEAIKSIEEAGGSVREIAQDDKRLEVDFHLASHSVKDDAVRHVTKVGEVLQLHLGGTEITDGALAHIQGLNSLIALHVENTKITNAGLENLKGLQGLEYLNLYGTAIGDAGLAHLKGLKNLKTLYVWQTKATEEGIAELKKALPQVDVNTGWELQEAEAEKEETVKDSK